MTSPQLVAQSERNVSEADIRALALVKVKTSKAYNDCLYANTTSWTDEQLIDRELELVAVRKAMFAAAKAFDEAI